MKRITKIAKSINVWLSNGDVGSTGVPTSSKWQAQSALQLQCLEDRILYSVVPMPVESLDVPADTTDTSDVEFTPIESNSAFLFSETVARGVTEILDEENQFVPAADATSASADLVLDHLDQLSDSINDLDARSSESSPSETRSLDADSPATAAGLVEVSPEEIATGFIALDEGQSFTINNEFLGDRALFYATGFRLTRGPVAGTIYVDGEVLSVGEFVSGASLANDEIIFVPGVSYTGDESFAIESDAAGLDLASDEFAILYEGLDDDGIAVFGDTFSPVDAPATVFSTSSIVAETQVQSLTDGGYVVASIISEDVGGVVLQKFDAEGLEVGDSVVVDNVLDQLSNLQIASVSDGGFLVAFSGEENGVQQIEILRYDDDGQVVALGAGSTSLTVASNMLSDSFSLLYLGEDRFLVTNVGQSSANNVTSAIYDFDGNLETTIISPMPVSTQDFVAPRAALLSDGGFILAWIESNGSGSRTIQATTFDPGGHATEENIAITVGNETDDLVLAGTPDNGFVVVFQGSQNDPNAILASRYNRAENLITTPVVIASGSPANDADPNVISLDDGSFVVSFTAMGESGVQEIVGQRLDENFSVFGSPFAIGTPQGESDTDSDLTLLTNGTLVASFEATELGSPTQILHQRLEMTVVSDGINPVSLLSVLGIDSSSITEVIEDVKIVGLPLGTRVSFVYPNENDEREVTDESEPLIFDIDDLIEILVTPPSDATGFITGTLTMLTNDGRPVGGPDPAEPTETNFRVIIDPFFDANVLPVQQFDEVNVRSNGEIQAVDLSSILIVPGQDPNTPSTSPIQLSLAGPNNGVSLVEENGVFRLEIDTSEFQGVSDTVVNLSSTDAETGEVFFFDLRVVFVEDVSISGIVANDVDVDGSIELDQGFANVSVHVFTAELGANGFEQEVLVDSVSTDSQGRFEFTGLEAGREYFVVVDSLTVVAEANDFGFVWAQQTFASQGAVLRSGSGLETTQQDGYLIGGRDSELTDLVSNGGGLDDGERLNRAQHIISVSTSGDLTNLDTLGFGFNFNIVNVIDSADQFLSPGVPALDGQGTLSQFIHNANNISGENRLIFVPTTDANVIGVNGERWWNIELTDLLPVIRDDFTIIDGDAYQISENGLVRHDLNPGFVEGTQAGQQLGVAGDRLGADDLFLRQVAAPDLEISIAEGLDDQGRPLSLEYGLKVRGDVNNQDVIGIEIRNIAINGFGLNEGFIGDQRNESANIIIDGRDENGLQFNVSNFTIEGNVIGARSDFSFVVNNSNNISVISASGSELPLDQDTGLGNFSNQIRGNLIVDANFRGVYLTNSDNVFDTSRISNLSIADNQISSNGLSQETRGDGIEIGFGTRQVTVAGNHISDNHAIGVDLFRAVGEIDILRNTFDNNGASQVSGTTEAGAIRLFGLNNEVFGNTFTNNEGPSVHVSGRRFAPMDTRLPSLFNDIRSNEFSDNNGISIDLSRPLNTDGDPDFADDFDRTANGFGDGVDADDPDDTPFDTFTGNLSVDAPKILSASFDGTVLSIQFSGDLNRSGDPREVVQIFLTEPGTPDGQGATILAEAQLNDLVFENGTFRLELIPPANLLPQDLTQQISVNATYTLLKSVNLEFTNGQVMAVEGLNTTEFSNNQSLEIIQQPTLFELSDSVEENSSQVADLGLILAGGEDVTYVIEDFGDGNLFQVNADGVVSFIMPPDFENPIDADGDNQYAISVIAIEEGQVTSLVNFTVDVTDVNEAPVITPLETQMVAEGSTAVGTIVATDVDGDTVAFSIDPNEADGALFTITSDGELRFINAPDFESPLSVSGTNRYSVSVIADDGDGGIATTEVLVDVTDVNEAPVITPLETQMVAEGSTAVGTIVATDVDGDTVAFSIDPNEADGALFTITSDGELRFINAPDFESPLSVSGTNRYSVSVIADDGDGGIATTEVFVDVTDVNEAPTLIVSENFSVVENERFVGSVSGDDGDGDDVSITISGGPDADLFSIDSDGNLNFIATPDFENPADANGDNGYQIEIRGDDGDGGFSTRLINVWVTPVNERPFYTGDQFDRELMQFESSEQSFALAELFDDPEADDLELQIVGGADADLFEIIDNELKLIDIPELTGPDSPVYEVQIVASDGSLVSSVTTFDLIVNNINDQPEITNEIPTVEFEQEELQSRPGIGLNQIATFDADGDDVSFRIDGNGTDNDLFEIVGQEIVFRDIPQLFGGQQRVFGVTIVANDGVADSSPESIAIVATNINDAPIIQNAAPVGAIDADLNGNQPLFTFDVFDPDADEISFEIAGGTDAELFTINDQGQLFLMTPQAIFADDVIDSGQLEVQIRATDGDLFSPTQTILFSLPDNAEEAGVSVIDIPTTPPTIQSPGSEDDDELVEPGEENFEDVLSVIPTARPVAVPVSSTTQSDSSQRFDFNAPAAVIDSEINNDDAFLALTEDVITYVTSADDQAPQLLKEEVGDLVDLHRAFESGKLEESLLANYFWQGFDESETEFMRKNLQVDTAMMAAASAGISLGLASWLRIALMATTVATQIPTWKTLDVTPLINAFDEGEAETIHQIVDA